MSRTCVTIIPAWRAETTIARTLESLRGENARYVSRTLVVAAAGDPTIDIARRFDGVEVVRLPKRTTAGLARNIGRAHAPEAEALLFLDADCSLAAGALDRMLARLEQVSVDAAGALIERAGDGAVSWLRHLLEFKDYAPGCDVGPCTFHPSAALLVRAAAFDRAGGFPDLWPGEDLVFCHRLRACGGTIVRVEDARVFHLHPQGWRALFVHQRRLGETSAAARALTGMHGVSLLGRPWLVPLLFLGRVARAAVWTAARPRDLARFVVLAPAVFLGLAAWSAGFARWRPEASRT